MEDKKKEPCENKAQENPWSTRARYEYLKKMSELAINTLAENELALNKEEAETFLKLFATELKFKWHIKNRESNF